MRVGGVNVFAVFVDPIFPVFAITAVGFVMGRVRLISTDEARIINRFAMTVLIPVVVFGLVANADVARFSAAPLIIYFAVEAAVFALGFVLARRVFGRAPGEAILLAFGGIFANNVFFTLPIAILLYGEDGVLAITAILTLDTTVVFALAMIAMQVISLGKPQPLAVVKTLARTPLLQALALGVLVNASGFGLPAPIQTFVGFNGAAAAPVALFSLGVVLSTTALMPDAVVLTFGAIKLFVMPLLLALGIVLFAPSVPSAQQFVMGAAGPSGAMAFSLAMLHGVRTDAIAKLIIWTTIASLFMIAALA